MPWQAVPPMLIIGGAFGAVGGLLSGIHYVAFGKSREVGHDQWSFSMENRDEAVEKYLAAQKKK